MSEANQTGDHDSVTGRTINRALSRTLDTTSRVARRQYVARVWIAGFWTGAVATLLALCLGISAGYLLFIWR